MSDEEDNYELEDLPEDIYDEEIEDEEKEEDEEENTDDENKNVDDNESDIETLAESHHSTFRESKIYDENDFVLSSTLVKNIMFNKPEDRITDGELSQAEMTKAIGIRTSQIKDFNNCLVNIDGLTDPNEMAIKELLEGKSPLKLARYVRTDEKGIEYYDSWLVNELVIKHDIFK